MPFLRIVILGSWLVGVVFGAPRATWQDNDPTAPSGPENPRLVVLEGFFRDGCGYSAATGPVFDQLAQEYAGRAVMIEYNYDLSISQFRWDYWWYGSGQLSSAYLPYTMVDSGHDVHSGFTTYAAAYVQHLEMIEDALARPALAQVTAGWQRVGDAARVTVDVTNLSGVTLGQANRARVHILVYEEARVLYTGRYLRGYAVTPIASLANNAAQRFTLNSDDLAGVDWSKIHVVALADYYPNGSSGAYDQLQAAIAEPTEVTTIRANPNSLSFQVTQGDPAPAAQPIALSGTDGAAWTATSSATWLTVNHTGGTLPADLQASMDPDGLEAGVYSATITFRAGQTATEVTTVAAVGEINWIYLPLGLRQ